LAKELDDDAEPPLESDIQAKSAVSLGHAGTNTLSPPSGAGQGSSPVIIQGEAGAGKSALLALAAVEHARQHGWRTVLADLPAGTPGAERDVTTVTQGWVRHLARSFDLWSTAPDNLGTLPLHTLFNVLGEMLRQATEQLHEGAFLLLAIDAVDGLLIKSAKGQGQHFSAALDVGEMVGRHLPPKTVLVLSTRHTRVVVRRGGGDAARPTGVLPPVILPLRGLSMTDKASITRAVLARYGKRLSEDTFDNQLVALTTKRGAQNPLYLRLACEDLRQAANFEGLGQHIRQLPSDVTELFGAVLRRLELDVGRDVVSRALCLLLHAPEGLTEADIVDLLAGRAWHSHSAAASLLQTLCMLAAPANRGPPGLSGLSGSQQQGAAVPPAAAMAADILTHWAAAVSQLQAAQLLRQLSPFLATGEAGAEAATGAGATRLALLNPALRSACEQRYLGSGAGAGSGRRDDQRKALAMAAHGMLAAHAASQADPRDDMSFVDAEGAALVTLLKHVDALHELGGVDSTSKGFSVEGLAGNFAFLVAAAASGAETLDGIHDVLSASQGGKSGSRMSTHGASASSLSKPSLLRRKRALEQQQASPTAVETAAFLSRHRQSLVVAPFNFVQLAANDMLAPGLRHQARRLIQDGPPASFGQADVGAVAPLASESSLRPPRSYPLQARGELLVMVDRDMESVDGGKKGFSRLLVSTLATQALPSVPTALAVCASADLAAVGLRSGQILLLEASTHRILDTLSGHVGEVTALAFAAAPSSAGAAVVPGGPYLYSTSVDNLAFAWDVASRRPLATSRKHGKRASACAAAPDGGGVFATAGWDGEVYIFRNNRTRQFTHATKGAGAPSGPVTATEFCPWQPELLAYASWDRCVYVYDTAKQELVHKMRGHSSSIRTLTWVEDGAQGVRHLASLDAGGSVVLWDVAVGRSVGRFVAHRERGSHAMATAHALVTTSGAGVVRLWRPSPGLPTAELSAPRMAQPGADTMALAGPARRIRTVSNAEGQTLTLTAHHDGSIALAGANAAVEGASAMADGEADEAEARLRAAFALPPPGGHSGESTEITAALAAIGDATCRSGGRANFQAHKMPVVALDASFSFFNDIKDAAGRPSSVPGEPEGGLLTMASASGDGELVLWTANLSSGQLVKATTLVGHHGGIHDVALDPRGRGTLVSVGDDRMVHVWSLCVDTETDDAGASAPPADSGLAPRVRVFEHHELAFHEGAATGVVFGVSGRFFVTCGRDGHLAVWSSVTRDIVASVKQAHSDWIHAVDMSLNEKWVASVGNDGLCRLWHMERQGARGVLLTAHKTLSGHDLAPSMVAFCRTAGDSHDNGLEEDLLATASADGGIRVWSASDGAAMASLRVDTGDHGAAALSWLTSTACCSRPPGEGADDASSRLLVGLPSGAARFYAPRAPLLLSERTLGHGSISAVGKRRLPDGEERVLVACHDRSLHELCVPPADVHAAAADRASLTEPAKHTLAVDLLGDAQAPLVGLSPVGTAAVETAWRLWRGQFLAPPAGAGANLLSEQVALPAVAAAGVGPSHVVAALPRALVLLAQTSAGLQRVSAVTTNVPLTCVAVAPDHGYVAAGGWNGYLVVGSLRNLTEEHEVCGRPQNSNRWVSAVAFAPDGEHLAVLYFDGLLEIWDLQRMALVVGGVAEVPACGLESHWAVSLAWTTLGIFVGCDDGRVAAWGAGPEEAGLLTLQQPAFIFDAAPGAGVGAMCGLVNGIVVGGTDGVVRLWQVRATAYQGQDGSFDVREVGIFECGAACSSIAAVHGWLLCGDAAGHVHCVQRIPRPLAGPASTAKLRTPIVF
jgi:WD40 repeat protein